MNGVDRSELQVLSAKVDVLSAKIDLLTERQGSMKDTLGDHEGRLRQGERWRYSLPTALFMAAASMALTFWKIGVH